MKNSEESYTIFIFRGATANPIRLRFRKSLVRFYILLGVCVFLLQGGLLTHYFFSTESIDWVGEREKRTVNFSGADEYVRR